MSLQFLARWLLMMSNCRHNFRNALFISDWTKTTRNSLGNLRYFYENLLETINFPLTSTWLLGCAGNNYNLQFFFIHYYLQEMEASENPSLQTTGPDPMLFCTASKKNRFYVFSTRQPDLRWVFHGLCAGGRGGVSQESVRDLWTCTCIPPTMGSFNAFKNL